MNPAREHSHVGGCGGCPPLRQDVDTYLRQDIYCRRKTPCWSAVLEQSVKNMKSLEILDFCGEIQ